MRDKIKVLFMSASPEGLASDREIREIEEKIRSAPYGNEYELVSVWAVRTSDIMGHLLRHRPQVVHFSGHGRECEGIYLRDEHGRPVPVSAATMVALFEPLRGTTRIVVLNACETREMAEALSKFIDYVIGMRRPITDEAAVVFGAAFYEALAHRESPCSAFRLALASLDLQRIPEAHVPELITRPGLPPEAPVQFIPREKPAPPSPGSRDAPTIQNNVGSVNTMNNYSSKE